jgi:hypothetical protein
MPAIVTHLLENDFFLFLFSMISNALNLMYINIIQDKKKENEAFFLEIRVIICVQ